MIGTTKDVWRWLDLLPSVATIAVGVLTAYIAVSSVNAQLNENQKAIKSQADAGIEFEKLKWKKDAYEAAYKVINNAISKNGGGFIAKRNKKGELSCSIPKVKHDYKNSRSVLTTEPVLSAMDKLVLYASDSDKIIPVFQNILVISDAGLNPHDELLKFNIMAAGDLGLNISKNNYSFLNDCEISNINVTISY